MEFVNKIINYLNNDNSSSAPEGVCPNCWGRQEYEGDFKNAIRSEKIDLNNIDQHKGWIQAYAAKHFDGIKLQDGSCPVCK